MEKEMYLYCTINKRSKKSLGGIGFQDQEVYLIPYKNVSVVVQACDIKGLRQMPKSELAINHQYVMDFVMRGFSEVIPFNLGTAVKNKKNLNKLLKIKYKKIKSELEEKKDKREYNIQIFYLPSYLQETSVLTNVKSFILQQQQKRRLSMQKENEYKNLLLNEVKELTEETKINAGFKSSIKEWKNKRILLNLNCLVHKNNAKKLEKKLTTINNKKEFSVNFNGPWAPYSFTKIFEE